VKLKNGRRLNRSSPTVPVGFSRLPSYKGITEATKAAVRRMPLTIPGGRSNDALISTVLKRPEKGM